VELFSSVQGKKVAITVMGDISRNAAAVASLKCPDSTAGRQVVLRVLAWVKLLVVMPPSVQAKPPDFIVMEML